MLSAALLYAAGGVVTGSSITGIVTALMLRSRHRAGAKSDRFLRPMSQSRLLAVIEPIAAALPVAMVVLDSERRIVHTSPYAEAEFSGGLNAIERHPAFQSSLDRLKEKDATRNAAPEEALIVQDVPVRRVVRALFQRYVFSPYFLAVDQNRKKRFARDIALTFVVLHDVTKMEMAERQHADFVAYASHELRTPLAALLGFIETLQGPAAGDPDAQKEFLSIMAEQGQRMQRLLDGLLYLSKVQMLEHQRPRGQIVLEELCRKLEREASVLCRRQKTKLHVVVSDLSVQSVAGDTDQMVQVLMNLVENALKYATQDSDLPRDHKPEITVTCRDAEPGKGWPGHPGVEIRVSDNGPGIAARHLPRLTERFYRVPRTSAVVQGSGLGLAIVQHIIARHGGRFRIESVVGQGTDCLIWLPAHVS